MKKGKKANQLASGDGSDLGGANDFENEDKKKG